MNEALTAFPTSPSHFTARSAGEGIRKIYFYSGPLRRRFDLGTTGSCQFVRPRSRFSKNSPPRPPPFRRTAKKHGECREHSAIPRDVATAPSFPTAEGAVKRGRKRKRNSFPSLPETRSETRSETHETR